MYPIKHKFIKEKQHPKNAVPDYILDVTDWHWDPSKKDHNDSDSFMGTVDYDWKELEAWSLDMVDRVRTPQRYWHMDFEKGVIWHSNEMVNGTPIYEQARQHFETNGFNEHNTQYFKVKDKELEKHFEPLDKMFNMSGQNMSLFVQLPGQTIPSHADTYSTYKRNNPAGWGNYKTLQRYMIFVNDWDWGQFFHMGNHVLQPWTAGDLWQIPVGVYHGSANCGINPKITFHWSGNTPEGTSPMNEINFKNARST
jgi:hypothetical protein